MFWYCRSFSILHYFLVSFKTSRVSVKMPEKLGLNWYVFCFQSFWQKTKAEREKGTLCFFPLCDFFKCAHTVPYWAPDMRFCLKLPQGSAMSANSKGSGETALMRSLARAFAGRQCDKYPSIMFWFIYRLTCTLISLR